MDSFCYEDPSSDIEGDGAESTSAVMEWSLPVARIASSVAEKWLSVTPDDVGSMVQHMQSVLLGNPTIRGDELLRASNCLRSESSTPSEMMQSLSSALEQQQQINENHGQLARMNSFVNVVNFARQQKVEQALVQGHRHLSRLSSHVQQQAETIDELEHSVDGLRQEVVVQQQVSGRLSMSLDEQGVMIRDSIEEQRRELHQQSAILAQQHHLLERVLKNKLRQDCVIDCGLVMGSFFLVNTLFFNLPLSIVLAAVPHQKFRAWLRQCIKLLAASRILFWARPYAIRAGAHSGHGALLPYAREGGMTLLRLLRFSLYNARSVAIQAAQRLRQ